MDTLADVVHGPLKVLVIGPGICLDGHLIEVQLSTDPTSAFTQYKLGVMSQSHELSGFGDNNPPIKNMVAKALRFFNGLADNSGDTKLAADIMAARALLEL